MKGCMKILSIILGTCVILYLIIIAVVKIGELKVENVTSKYINEMYTFKYKIKSCKYELVSDSYVVIVKINNNISGSVETFKLRCDNKKIVSDSYLQEYFKLKLSDFFTQPMNDIWGQKLKVSVYLDSAQIRRVPLKYTTDTSIEVLREIDYQGQKLIISVDDILDKNNLNLNLLETIKAIKEFFPKWQSLTIVVKLADSEKEQVIFIPEIEKIEELSDIENFSRILN